MKDSVRTALLLLAPCVALGGLALLMSRRAQAPFLSSKPSKAPLGPFSIAVAGAETQKLLPLDVYEGFDHHFHLLFRDKGGHPKWWGTPISSRTGTQMEGWNFWLERGGKRTRFRPKNAQIWTTGWDAKKKRYFNEFLLHCGEVPTDAALKMSGKTQLALTLGSASTALIPTLPFIVTLKKAGTRWERPHVSTAPGAMIQSVEISRPSKGQVVAKVKVLMASGVEIENSKSYSCELFDARWKPLPEHWLNTSFSSFSPQIGAPPKTRSWSSEIGWKSTDISANPARNIILSLRYSMGGAWPLQIAFPVKKNGQMMFGKVPVLRRPRGK